MKDPLYLSVISQLLMGFRDTERLDSNIQHLLICKGALFDLMLDGSLEAIQLLEKSAILSDSAEIRDFAFLALDILSVQGNQFSQESIFRLEIEFGHPLAPEILISRHITVQQPAYMAVHYLLNNYSESLVQTDPELDLISEFFLQTNNDTQKRMLQAASQMLLNNWVTIMNVVKRNENKDIAEFIDEYETFNQKMRNISLRELKKGALKGFSAAQEIICRLFVKYDDRSALTLARELAIFPTDPTERSVFLFLSDQWDMLKHLDLEHSLLNHAYELASTPLRRRIMTHSRYTGQTGWLNSHSGGLRTRLIDDLTNADWGNMYQSIKTQNDQERLWQLAQVCPPRISVEIILYLANSDWRPGNPEDNIWFEKIKYLAASCVNGFPEMQPYCRVEIPLPEIACMAYHSSSHRVVVGSSNAQFCILDITDAESRGMSYTFPTPIVRAMEFSPDGEYLVCAGGDQKIRIFDINRRIFIKTLEGHTGMIRSIKFCPDGRLLCSAGFDGTIRTWRFPQGNLTHCIQIPDAEILAMAVNTTGSHIIGSGVDGQISVWSLPDLDFIRTIAENINAIIQLAVSTGELVCGYSSDKKIRIWNYATSNLLGTLLSEQEVTALLFSAREELIIAGGVDGRITAWDSSSTGLLAESASSSRFAIIGLGQDIGGSTIVSVTADGVLSLWNLDFITMLNRPIGSSTISRINYFNKRGKFGSKGREENIWAQFVKEITSFNHRFDIELTEARIISAGDFEILV